MANKNKPDWSAPVLDDTTGKELVRRQQARIAHIACSVSEASNDNDNDMSLLYCMVGIATVIVAIVYDLW